MAYNVNNPINSRITSIGGHTYPSSQSVTSDISLTVPEEGNTNDVEHVLPAFNNGVSETINAKRKTCK